MFSSNERKEWKPAPTRLNLKWNSPAAILLSCLALCACIQNAEAVAPFTKLYQAVYDYRSVEDGNTYGKPSSLFCQSRPEAVEMIKRSMVGENTNKKVGIIEISSQGSFLTPVTDEELKLTPPRP